MNFTRPKFQSLSTKLQHKKIAASLKKLYFDPENLAYLNEYRKLELWMNSPKATLTKESISDLFHHHVKCSGIDRLETNLLIDVNTSDTPNQTPNYPIDIYLENLRSAHNVGSIIRTVEAFRLGTLHLTDKTPGISHPKVQAASMGAYPFVTQKVFEGFEKLRSPLVALETVKDATCISDFIFPKSFTLLLCNEEYGLSQCTLQKADHFIQIPLRGYKNSLNVSNAFAIAAGFIQTQLQETSK